MRDIRIALIADLRKHIVNTFSPIPPKSEVSHLTLSALASQASMGILDTVAYIFSLPIPPDVNEDTPDLPPDIDGETVSTDDYNEKCAAWVPEKNSTYWREYLQSPHSRTRIPVPQPRYPHMEDWLIMDKIDGDNAREFLG
ncbi:unnamed protein product [Somion occarium]|uniref:Uncharacterized protein n=1 Tax=Somion occarium TaxID=3059160 RepID=A0ABP1D772_9APHY